MCSIGHSWGFMPLITWCQRGGANESPSLERREGWNSQKPLILSLRLAVFKPAQISLVVLVHLPMPSPPTGRQTLPRWKTQEVRRQFLCVTLISHSFTSSLVLVLHACVCVCAVGHLLASKSCLSVSRKQQRDWRNSNRGYWSNKYAIITCLRP